VGCNVQDDPSQITNNNEVEKDVGSERDETIVIKDNNKEQKKLVKQRKKQKILRHP